MLIYIFFCSYHFGSVYLFSLHPPFFFLFFFGGGEGCGAGQWGVSAGVFLSVYLGDPSRLSYFSLVS